MWESLKRFRHAKPFQLTAQLPLAPTEARASLSPQHGEQLAVSAGWRLSLPYLFLAVALIAMGLAYYVAMIRNWKFIDNRFSEAFVLLAILPFGSSIVGAGIGALVGTRKAILWGFGWGYLLALTAMGTAFSTFLP